MMNMHYYYQIWLFQQILDRLLANGHLLYEIYLPGKELKISSNYLSIDRFKTDFFRIPV